MLERTHSHLRRKKTHRHHIHCTHVRTHRRHEYYTDKLRRRLLRRYVNGIDYGWKEVTALGRTHDQWMASVGNSYEAAKKKWNADNALAQKNKQPSPPKPSPPATPEPTRPDDARLPAILNNALVAPLAPYALKGVIWYQGESNLGQQTYLSLLSTLIESWRKQWHRDDLPFLFVQAPPHPAKQPLPGDNSTFAWLREAQVLTLKKVPNTGMAATIDLPYDKTIRSVNNATVAQRLVSLARNLAYKEDIVSACPIFDSFRIDGNKI